MLWKFHTIELCYSEVEKGKGEIEKNINIQTIKYAIKIYHSHFLSIFLRQKSDNRKVLGRWANHFSVNSM